jgi:hypothetical protein
MEVSIFLGIETERQHALFAQRLWESGTTDVSQIIPDFYHHDHELVITKK